MMYMKYVAVLVAFFSTLIPPVAFADDLGHLQSISASQYHLLQSTTMGRDFHIYVALPDDYDLSGDRRYPAIYILDGGTLFPMLLGYYRYLRFAEEAPESIVVGISYGNDNFGDGNYRSTDYTAPATDRDYWGGAATYQEMLESELLPLIENSYRADPGKRAIFGHSIGGQFVLFTALTKPGLFHGYIASNPALHRNLPFFLQKPAARKTPGNDSRLFVGSGSRDDPRFREPAVRWMNHWSEQTDTPWQLEAVTLGGHNHFSAPPAAFRGGLKWVFVE